MYISPERIAATNKASIETLVGLANTQFATLARLSALNFSTANSVFKESGSYTKSLLGAKDARKKAA